MEGFLDALAVTFSSIRARSPGLAHGDKYELDNALVRNHLKVCGGKIVVE